MIWQLLKLSKKSQVIDYGLSMPLLSHLTMLLPICIFHCMFFVETFPWSPSWKVVSALTKITSLSNECEYWLKKIWNIHLYPMWVLQLDQQIDDKHDESIIIRLAIRW